MTTDLTQTDEAEIRQLMERRAAATRAKDADAATAAFADDVLTFDVVNPLQHRGVGSVRERTTQWFETFDGPIGYEMRHVEISASDDSGFAYCLYRVSGTLTSDDELEMWVRATFCFRKLDSGWRIVHEHDSVPFDPTTGMASLGLKPI